MQGHPRERTIGLFGCFYPEFQKAGNSTTGFARIWASDATGDRVIVIAPQGSLPPPGARSARLEVLCWWRLDGAWSLLRTLARLVRRHEEFDLLVFNIHLTSFGTRPVVNAIGLSLPRWWALLTRRRPVVFLHHLLESQDVAALGYKPSGVTRRIVHRLERGLLESSDVVVPLDSQRKAALGAFGREVRVVFPSFIEAAGSGIVSPTSRPTVTATRAEGPLRLLLFGYWGPQKELEGALTDLAEVRLEGRELRVSVAGEVNRNFPEFAARIRASAERVGGERFRFLGPIPETEVERLLEEHDVLLLPYRATGGYSGALNLAAATGIGLVAYDLPQLRETAAALGVEVEFVPPRDVPALGKAIATAGTTRRVPEDAWGRAVAAGREVLGRASV